jgi:hypothetical protein
MPYGVYVFAYTTSSGTSPIGMAESLLVQQRYESYEQTPYGPSFDLESICPFSQMASIRTVYAEPDVRLHHGLYLKLILASAYVYRSLGALYAVATTNAEDERLARLYEKTGGRRLTTFTIPSFHPGAIALYVFELDALLAHPWTPRMLRDLDLRTDVIVTARTRNRRQESPELT